MYTYISCGESGNEFPDNFEFTTEEGVFVLLELVFVHAKEIKVDSGNGFDETFERGGELELPEEAGGNASGGGAGQTDLQILRSISNFTSFFFSNCFQQIHIISVSGHWTHFIFKIFQTVAGIRMTSQFCACFYRLAQLWVA